MASRTCDGSQSTENLCGRCRNIPAETFYSSKKSDIGSEYTYGPRKRHQLIGGPHALDEVRRAAKDGCELCTIFEDALSLCIHDPWEQLRRQPQYCDTGLVLEPHHSDSKSITLTFGLYSHYDLDVRISVERSGKDPEIIFPTWLGKPGSYLIEPSADTSAALALVRSWIAKCVNNHAECAVSARTRFPRRLIDVGQQSIRLVPTNDLRSLGEEVHYIALSHCWGGPGATPPKTTTKTLETFERGVLDSEFPPTFLDAIRTTRALGFRYLWIDSLCIIQDDSTDFEIECANMNSIYSNADLTIAASDAKNCQDGFLRQRTITPVRLVYEATPEEPKMEVVIWPGFGSWEDGLKGPLQSRTWVLQERHLSPRVLHYTRKRMLWECRKSRASENSQEMEAGRKPRFLDGGNAALEEKGMIISGHNPFHGRHRRWYTIVEEYSRRNLSHPEDRLNALSGFAAEWNRLTPEDSYMAGLWRSDFFRGLAWFPSTDANDIMRRLPECDSVWPPCSPYPQIPSWSWAAYDGPIIHFGKDWYDPTYDVPMSRWKVGEGHSPKPCSLNLISVSTKVMGENPFGRVSEGELVLSHWSIEVTIDESAYDPGRLIAVGDGPKGYKLHPDLRYTADGMVYFDTDPFILPRIDLLLLQLGHGSNVHHSSSLATGLALSRVQAQGHQGNEHTYRRVGMWDILDDYDFWIAHRKWRTVTVV